ncbi:MAG TPA: LytTR family DNA-binding domain-containing protein [Rudaea sp.]|jgi:two-component system response regulator AlgR|uniref:LytR/AlgR family response regulator transcription factor n=1 Tax=Rudaea sp. TaxID=2136325 RepID=UPI002F937794
MKALIVDDEPPARARLVSLLQECGDVELLGEAGDGRTAVEIAARLAPDLVLLDISMPLMNGLEAARHLATLDPAPAVIFCTAFDEHALAAFDANAIDYLVKPIRLERLQGALARAQRYSGGAVAKLQLEQLDAQSASRTHLCVRVRGNLVLVPVTEIDYLMAEDKYVVVHYRGNAVLIEEPLKALETEFGGRFVRIHRNCLVAKARLVGLVRTTDEHVFAKIAGCEVQLEVSRRNLPVVRRAVKGA